MNNTFKANLLKTLANKKGNKGFTLIELLVVVIIIGVLAALALPNLLGQVGKARESEAKSQLGAINRAQQAFFTERGSFATSSFGLEVPLGNEKFYLIVLDDTTAGLTQAQGADQATIQTNWNAGNSADPPVDAALTDVAAAQTANAANGTRDYLAGISYHSIDRSFATAVCRSTDRANNYTLPAGIGTNMSDVGQVAASGSTGDGQAAGCGGDTVEVK